MTSWNQRYPLSIVCISQDCFEFIFGIKTDKAKSGKAGVNPTVRDLLCFHYFGWMSTPSMASHLASKYFL